MPYVPIERHLLKAKDLADGKYHEDIGVDDMAEAAGLSRAHFSRAFKRVFGEPPNTYLLTRRLERAAALLRNTDRPVNELDAKWEFIGTIEAEDLVEVLIELAEEGGLDRDEAAESIDRLRDW